MLRAAARSSSLIRRLAAAAFIPKHELPNPLITAAVVANPGRTDLAAYHSQASLLFFPSFLGQTRGYARRRPTTDDDGDFSDNDKDFANISDDDDVPFDDTDDKELMGDYIDEDGIDDKSD